MTGVELPVMGAINIGQVEWLAWGQRLFKRPPTILPAWSRLSPSCGYPNIEELHADCDDHGG